MYIITYIESGWGVNVGIYGIYMECLGMKVAPTCYTSKIPSTAQERTRFLVFHSSTTRPKVLPFCG